MPIPDLVAAILLSGLSAQAPPASQPAAVPMEEDDRLKTRYGAVILEKSEDASLARWRIRLDERTLVETEDDKLGLWELFEGDGGFDYVIIRRDSGGIACPYQFRVIELDSSGKVSLSDEFGSCLDPKRTRLYGGALVLDMSAYVPHPELLSASDLRRRRQTTEIYTVTHGKITMRAEIRR